MSNEKTEKTEKNDREVSLTRRTVIKTAAWAVPTILSIGLPVGNVFAQASSGGETDPTGPRPGQF